MKNQCNIDLAPYLDLSSIIPYPLAYIVLLKTLELPLNFSPLRNTFAQFNSSVSTLVQCS